jgi:hypothetical protein
VLIGRESGVRVLGTEIVEMLTEFETGVENEIADGGQESEWSLLEVLEFEAPGRGHGSEFEKSIVEREAVVKGRQELMNWRSRKKVHLHRKISGPKAPRCRHQMTKNRRRVYLAW